MDDFLRDRKEALLSLNLEKINAYMAKYGNRFTFQDDEDSWASIHKARTAALDLPEEEREASRQWLAERGWKALA